MPIRKIVLIQPRRDGRFMGRGISEPYTLMRLASLVDPQIPVEIWDGDLMELPIHQLGPQDLVGISSKTVIDRPHQGADGRRSRSKAPRSWWAARTSPSCRMKSSPGPM